PILDARLTVEHLLEEDLVGLVPVGVDIGPGPVPFSALAAMSLILPPSGNPFRLEIDEVAAAHGLTLSVPVEVEGVRLIADLVAAGRGASILPETAVPPGLSTLRTVSIIGMPPRRLALVTARQAYLSLADRAVRDSVRRLVNAHRAA
ncbi:MAG: LysR substrate-binding domain-containing protein, partial [Acidimicrobiia bacterium]